MGEPGLTKDDIAKRGRDIYERDIRAGIEHEHDGEFLVVDVVTGEYEVGEDDDEVFGRSEARNPDGLFFLMRVGRPAAHRIGGSSP